MQSAWDGQRVVLCHDMGALYQGSGGQGERGQGREFACCGCMRPFVIPPGRTFVASPHRAVGERPPGPFSALDTLFFLSCACACVWGLFDDTDTHVIRPRVTTIWGAGRGGLGAGESHHLQATDTVVRHVLVPGFDTLNQSCDEIVWPLSKSFAFPAARAFASNNPHPLTSSFGADTTSSALVEP